MKINRREAVLGMSSTLLMSSGCRTTSVATQTFSNQVFAHGVASGDPGPDSVVLWTRISGGDGNVPVLWSVAENPDFDQPVATGSITTNASRDYTVKAVAEGLEPGKRYYYRFRAGGADSPVGRTLTLPEGSVDELVIAVVSCSNYPFGYFNAYEAVADDPDVDIVVHLGDYIYEYDEDGYGGEAGKRLGRVHDPRHEMLSLDDYRRRHAQYKTDRGSLAMHAMHPLIHTWDDHESTNNPWEGGAQNHQEDEGDWEARRARSLQAYYEWMPSRDPEPGRRPEERWDHFKFGDLASLYTLESRHTARSEQISLADYRDELTDSQSAQAVYDRVVGPEHRRMLSQEMEDFLERELKESVDAGRTWRILANQTILARVVQANLDEPQFNALRARIPESGSDLADLLTTAGKLGLTGNMDAWDGYPAARRRLYDLAARSGSRDLLTITGDTHIFWQNQLFSDSGDRMGVELGTSAITSPRGYYELGPEATARMDELLAEQNESVVWIDGQSRGFIRLSLTPERARADYISVSNIESERYATSVLRSVRIERRDGTLYYT